MVRLAIATIFLIAVAVVVTNAEAAVTKSKYAYATIHYEGTPKDAGNVNNPYAPRIICQ